MYATKSRTVEYDDRPPIKIHLIYNHN